jgi:hypothetical protein
LGARRNSRSGAPSKLDPKSSRSSLRFLSVNGSAAMLCSISAPPGPLGLCATRPRGFEPLTFGSVGGGPNGPASPVLIGNSLHSARFPKGHKRTPTATAGPDLLPPRSHRCSHRSADRSRASAHACGVWSSSSSVVRSAGRSSVTIFPYTLEIDVEVGVRGDIGDAVAARAPLTDARSPAFARTQGPSRSAFRADRVSASTGRQMGARSKGGPVGVLPHRPKSPPSALRRPTRSWAGVGRRRFRTGCCPSRRWPSS